MKHTAMDRRIETLKLSVAIEELQPHRVVSGLSEVKDLQPTIHAHVSSVHCILKAWDTHLRPIQENIVY
jgi:hypothetical protein